MDDRLALVSADQRICGLVEGGREEEGLPGGRRAVEEPPHLREEAHVRHPVGLVDHNHLDGAELSVAAVDQVGEAAGTRDEHVDSSAEGAALGFDPDPSVARGDADAARGAEPFELTTNLGRQLAGGDQHEGTRPPRFGVPDAGDERDPKGERLARARRGLAADIASSAGIGEGQSLNGQRAVEATRGQVGDERRRHAEVGEGGGHDGEMLRFCGPPAVGGMGDVARGEVTPRR